MIDSGPAGRRQSPARITDQREAEYPAGGSLADLGALERFGLELKARNLARILILTFGGWRGCLVRDGNHPRKAAKGRGDQQGRGWGQFVGGLMLKLSHGASLREACFYAVAAPATELATQRKPNAIFP